MKEQLETKFIDPENKEMKNMREKVFNEIPEFSESDSSHIKFVREESRKKIAYAVIAAYLFLLLFNISIPIILYLISKPSTPLQISDIKDLTLAISAAISSLVGILGFVMGYYFKSKEEEKKI